MHFVEPIRDERCLYLSNYVCTKVLYWLSCVGYTKLRWGVVHAEHVGLPMKRARWFMLGIRPGADDGKLERLAHSVSKRRLTKVQKLNLPIAKYMLKAMPDDASDRLTQVGNCVVPDCATLALYELTETLGTRLLTR